MDANVRTSSADVSFTPTITAAAYSANDQVGGVNEISGLIKNKDDACVLLCVTLLDKDKQNAEMDVLFFKTLPVPTSTNGDAVSISDAEMAKAIASVTITEDDYKDFGGSSLATSKNVGIRLKSTQTSKKLWAVLVTRGTPTYTSTSALVVTPHVLQD